jgi:hypothetical protein
MSDKLEKERKLFEDAQAAFRMAIFEAVRAQSVNRYKLEEAFKKYLERQSQYLGMMHDQLMKLSNANSAVEHTASKGTTRAK